MTRVAFLGLGRMGTPMAANLVRAGHDVTVWNRTAATAEQFAAQHSVRAAATPRDAARDADVVITMLADDAALVAAHHGPAGLQAGLREGSVVIDMSTVAPETVTALADELSSLGCQLVDAPVSGSVGAATAATLTILASGDERAVERVRATLDGLGGPVIYLGAVGRGSIMKLCVNAIVHSLNGAVSEALVLAERSGIAREQAYDVFANSVIAAPFVQYRRAAFENPGEVPVAFRLELAAKDLRLASAAAGQTETLLPQTAANLAVLELAVAAGYGDGDESALAEYLRAAAGH